VTDVESDEVRMKSGQCKWSMDVHIYGGTAPFGWMRYWAYILHQTSAEENQTSAPCPTRGMHRHCFTYIGSPNGPIQRPNPVRYVQYECYETTARSETRKLTRVRPARCPAWRTWP
jgi:hypothetical protein